MSGLIRVSDLAREGVVDRSIRRRTERGEMARVARGRYLPTSDWEALDRDDRYRARIHAFAETTKTTQVFSHWSAAALWGYPIIGAWPRRLHITFPVGTGQRSTAGVTRHITALDDDDVVELEGLFVTSTRRTLVDLARCAPFATGVAACDRALAEPRSAADAVLHVERDALLERAERLAGQRGVCRLRSVTDFADGRSGSPGESLSRVQIARLRLPTPDLQVEIVDLEGRTWHTDFGWRECGILGEFDGMVKYTRDRYLDGGGGGWRRSSSRRSCARMPFARPPDAAWFVGPDPSHPTSRNWRGCFWEPVSAPSDGRSDECARRGAIARPVDHHDGSTCSGGRACGGQKWPPHPATSSPETGSGRVTERPEMASPPERHPRPGRARGASQRRPEMASAPSDTPGLQQMPGCGRLF